MTALAVAPAAAAGPVPWRRLSWVAWRRYRTTLLATAGVLAVLSLYLAVNGHRMHSAYDAYLACRPQDSATCQFVWEHFRDSYGNGGLVNVVLLFVPGIIGVFAGAPLLSRELESGTFRYTFTQGAGRLRWALSVLVPGAVGVAALLAAFGQLVRWRDEPLVAGGVHSSLEPGSFPTSGIAVAGWALLGFALGVLAGLVWRKVVPALVTAGVLWFGLALLASAVRPHYEAPLRTTSLSFNPGDVQVSQWWVKDGARVSDKTISLLLGEPQAPTAPGAVEAKPGPADGTDPVQALLQQGYQQVTTYQPASRYWAFQGIELGWLLVASGALGAASVWLLRRRAA